MQIIRAGQEKRRLLGDAAPIAIGGASPFQAWEAWPFPVIPYRPHPIDPFGFFGEARNGSLGGRARRCCKSVVQGTVRIIA
jgi:hypothetical protein